MKSLEDILVESNAGGLLDSGRKIAEPFLWSPTMEKKTGLALIVLSRSKKTRTRLVETVMGHLKALKMLKHALRWSLGCKIHIEFYGRAADDPERQISLPIFLRI